VREKKGTLRESIQGCAGKNHAPYHLSRKSNRLFFSFFQYVSYKTHKKIELWPSSRSSKSFFLQFRFLTSRAKHACGQKIQDRGYKGPEVARERASCFGCFFFFFFFLFIRHVHPYYTVYTPLLVVFFFCFLFIFGFLGMFGRVNVEKKNAVIGTVLGTGGCVPSAVLGAFLATLNVFR
jgi:hypothetical protein